MSATDSTLNHYLGNLHMLEHRFDKLEDNVNRILLELPHPIPNTANYSLLLPCLN